jgi:hypothetical protein
MTYSDKEKSEKVYESLNEILFLSNFSTKNASLQLFQEKGAHSFICTSPPNPHRFHTLCPLPGLAQSSECLRCTFSIAPRVLFTHVGCLLHTALSFHADGFFCVGAYSDAGSLSPSRISSAFAQFHSI